MTPHRLPILVLAAFLTGTPLAAQAEIDVEEIPPAAPAAPARTATGASDPIDEGDLASLEREAMQRYADGELAAARALFVDLGGRHPATADRARLLTTAAWLSWQLDDRSAAFDLLESALYQMPDLDFRAEIYQREFVSLYRDALRNAVHRRRVVASETINRAVAEMRRGEYARARELLLDALRLTPDDPDGVYNLALVDLREGRTDAALAGFERVLALERGNPEGVTRALKSQALNNAAVAYYSRGDLAEAETALVEAVALDPDDAAAWFNLGLARQRLGRNDESRGALRRAHALAPDDLATTRALALAEIERRSWIDAVALLTEARDAHPQDAELALHLGRAQRGLGNSEGAAASFRASLELDPEDTARIGGTAALLLAETRRTLGDTAGSADAAVAATRLRPEDGGAWMLLGLARLESGQAGPASESLERARELAPERADIAHNLGTAYLALGLLQRADEAFAAALELDPANADTTAALVALRTREQPAAPAGPRELGARLVVGDYAELGIRGLRVEAVDPGSPAARAGLRAGDLILRAADRQLSGVDQMKRILRRSRGATALAVLRDGKPIEVRVRLD